MADGSQNSNVFDLRQIAMAIRRDKSVVIRRAITEQWPFTEQPVRGGKKRSYALVGLPADVQTALIVKHAPTPADASAPVRRTWNDEQLNSLNSRLERATDKNRQIAERRLRAILAVDALVVQGRGRLAARHLVAAQLQREGVAGGSAATLARWEAAVDRAPRPAWKALLLPEYIGRTVKAPMPEQAWDLFKSDWLRLEAPTASGCYERLQRIAHPKGWKLPCLATFQRRMDHEISRQVQILAREGEEALMRTYPAQERDRSMFNALDAVNADGHKFDVFVKWLDGSIVRPIMLGVQDLGFGKVLGYRIAETESSDLIRLAFMDVVRDFGIAKNVWLDNGRGFASKLITGGVKNRFRFKVRAEDPTGILKNVGMDIHWTQPYHGQSKPIERAWKDLCDRIAKHPGLAGAYTGNDPTAKPENYGSRAVPYDEFMRVVRDEMIAHNARPGRRTRVCNGRSFDEAFNENYARTAIRKATTEQLREMLLAAEVVFSNSQDGSVKLSGNRYWTEALTAHAGTRLTVRFDPDNLHSSVHCYTLAGVYVGEAECVAAVGFADTNAGREHARAKKHYRRATRDKLAAERRMEAAEVAAQIPSLVPPNLPEAQVITGMFGRKSAPKEVVSLQRTGTDGNVPHESRLAAHLKDMQERQLRNTAWPTPQDD